MRRFRPCRRPINLGVILVSIGLGVLLAVLFPAGILIFLLGVIIAAIGILLLVR